MKNTIILTAAIALLGATTVFGQKATHRSTASPLTCDNDAFHPIAGKAYPYTATVDPTDGKFKWWATTNAEFITSGTDNSDSKLTLVGTNYGTEETATTGEATTKVTWTDEILSKVTDDAPLFMVVKTWDGTDACANNIKPLMIKPKNGFTVDVLGLNPNTKEPAGGTSDTPDYTAKPKQCVSDIDKAHYNKTSKTMEYDYGTNELFFEVVAANFTKEYKLDLQLSGLDTNQTFDLDWTYNSDFSGLQSISTANAGGTLHEASVAKVETDETTTSNGVSIYVKVTVHNKTFETTAQQNVKLAVKGTSAMGADVANDNCDTPGGFGETTNNIEQIIKPRATVTNATTGGNFIE